MKKTILLFVLLAGFSWKGEAQHFIASFGVQHSWGVPYYVSDIIYDNYYDYDWVHTRRIVRGRYVTFNLILQRGNSFVELNVGRNGRISSTRYIDHYPLHDHVCGDYCGFHSSYYNTYYSTCSSHNHYGHNHIVYRPAIRRRIYHGSGYYYRKPYYARRHRHNNGYYYKGNNNGHKHGSHSQHHYNDNSRRNRSNGRSAYNKPAERRQQNNGRSNYNKSGERRQQNGGRNQKGRNASKQNNQRDNSKTYYTRRN